MIAKNFVFVLLATLLTLSVVSAFSVSVPTFNLGGDNSFNFTVNADSDNVTVNNGVQFMVDGTIVPIQSIKPSIPTNISASNSRTFNLTLSSNPFTQVRSYSVSLYVPGTNNTDNTPVNYTVSQSYSHSFCTNGESANNITVSHFTVSNDGIGTSSDWNKLDTINVDVEVRNRGASTEKNVVIELGMFDSSGTNVINNLDFSSSDNELINVGDISSSDTDTETFSFQVPSDFNTQDYTLWVKTYSDGQQVSECDDRSKDITVKSETDKGKYIQFNNLRVTPSQATCGDSVVISGDAVNLGSKTQDQIELNLTNPQLGINSVQEFKKNLNEGDKDSFSFAVNLPQNIQNKVYNLELTSDYDWKSSYGYVDTSSDSTLIPITVIGCVQVPVVNSAISASPDTASAGKAYSVTATVTNVGNSTATFNIDASNYNSWATLNDISDTSFSLSPGQSRDVTFNFNVNSDATGTKSFTIGSTVNGNTDSKAVQVAIQGSGSLGNWFQNNSLVWVIGLVNLILIVLIIVVAIKVARR